MQQSSLRFAFLCFGATQTLWCLPTLIDDFSVYVALTMLLPGVLYILLGAALPRVRAWNVRLVEWPPKLYAHVLPVIAAVMAVAAFVLPGVDQRSTLTPGDYVTVAIIHAGLGAVHLALWLFARRVNRHGGTDRQDVPEKMPRVAAMNAR